MPTITCRELIEFLIDYFEDRLDPAERRRFDQHLAICPDCRDYLQSYRRTAELGTVAFELDAAAEAPPDLIEAILRSRPSPHPASTAGAADRRGEEGGRDHSPSARRPRSLPSPRPRRR